MLYTIEDKILYRMEQFYASKDEAIKWYNEPHKFFLDHMRKKISPRDMVKCGRGEEVLEWVEICLE